MAGRKKRALATRKKRVQKTVATPKRSKKVLSKKRSEKSNNSQNIRVQQSKKVVKKTAIVSPIPVVIFDSHSMQPLVPVQKKKPLIALTWSPKKLSKKIKKLRRRVVSTLLAPIVFVAKWQKKLSKFGKKLFKKRKKTARKPTVLFAQRRRLTVLGRVARGIRATVPTAISLLLTTLILGGSWWIYDVAFRDLPSAYDLLHKEQPVSTKIMDRNGTVLFRIYKDENRTIVPLSGISEFAKQATIAIEDRAFYSHHGFSLKGMGRALLANWKGEEISQGGSTITQQLVKRRLLSPERTVKRKVRELILSLLVERIYTKDEILEMYLNNVSYGGSTYGIEEASWRYFNKPAAQLDLAESAMLAGLIAAPSAYSPFGASPELAAARQEEVLRRLVEDGTVSPEQAAAARTEELKYRQDAIDIHAPHFVMYVKKLLAERFGEDLLNEGGLEVRTTLDLELQDQVQNIVTTEVDLLARLRVKNGAALVTNPQTGEILAMVGSRNYFDFANDGQVNVVLRPRQPGSSIKPLTYAVALERGLTPSTLIDDSPITYKVVGSPPYSPKNYDGKYHGKVPLRVALASSYNVTAVKTMALYGVDAIIDKGEALGITTWKDRERFGLSLTLGGGEVRMIDMAQLYSTFATHGYPVEPNPILEIRNYKGEVYYRNDCVLEGVGCFGEARLNAKVAYIMSDILSDNIARSPAFGLHSVLTIPNQQVAVKTGTTNSMRDNWTIGYTTDRLVSTWVGNNDNTPMSYVASGVTGASPIWNKIIRLMLDEENPHRFATPSGMVRVAICAATGTLPCAGCPKVTQELFVAGSQPTKACNQSFFQPTPTLIPNL